MKCDYEVLIKCESCALVRKVKHAMTDEVFVYLAKPMTVVHTVQDGDKWTTKSKKGWALGTADEADFWWMLGQNPASKDEKDEFVVLLRAGDSALVRVTEKKIVYTAKLSKNNRWYKSEIPARDFENMFADALINKMITNTKQMVELFDRL